MRHGGRRPTINLVPYDAERHRGGVRGVLAKNGWEEHYIAGQLDELNVFSASPSSRTRGKVYVHEAEERGVGGFVSVEFRRWNRLGQLHGLAVDPRLKRRGIASALVGRAEVFVRREDGRGLYADTPVNNETARGFYEALGYRRAYVMPEYYDEGLDGVTYLKIFAEKGTQDEGRMIMFAGPSGAGKSSLARAWCATRPRAVHVELDKVRHLIVSGLADPQAPGPLQAEQYDTSVAACCTLVREFVRSGYDVAVDDAVDPKGFERHWRPRLGGIEYSVVVRPSLEAVLERGAGQIQTGTAGPGPRAARRGLAVANPANHRHYWPVRRGEPAERASSYRRRTLASGGGVHTQPGRLSPGDAAADLGPARGTDSKVNHAKFALRGFSEVRMTPVQYP